MHIYSNYSGQAVQPVTPARRGAPVQAGPARPETRNLFSFENPSSGAASYGPDGLLKGGQSAEADAAEQRTLNKLQARDSQVRDREEAKGEAVGGRAYIYQTGPDGKQYAVGTAPHTVKTEGQAGGPPNAPGASGEDDPQVDRLEARDSEVRAHEHAHMLAGGGQVGGIADYDYQTGPDGKQYAVGGSVSVVMTSVPGDPEATRRSADAAERAAMAPGSPSGQDFKVAADARRLRSRAEAEEQRQETAQAETLAEIQGSPEAGRQMARAMRAYTTQAQAVGA